MNVVVMYSFNITGLEEFFMNGKKVFIILLACISTTLSAGQRDKGEIVLKSLSIKNGKLSFETESGGCTTKKSFKINVESPKTGDGKLTNYIITITRIAPDDCKGFLPEGVLIEYDMEKDLGIKGGCTVTVKNMVLP